MRPALALIAAALAAPALATDPPAPAPSEIVAAAPGADWVAIAPADLLVMELAADAKGRARRVVIQLLPPPFSQGWVGNIRKLAAAHWWDGLSVNRVQDNYVAQWGDAAEDDPAKAKRLPEGLAVVPESEYVARGPKREYCDRDVCAGLISPMDWWRQGPQSDPYVFEGGVGLVGFGAGWPLVTDQSSVWPIHCYGMVGVGRAMPPDTGTGAELYAVIGHAPRHLDRNIALIGRVIEGIEHLSSLPRGHGALGFYDPAQGDERVGIVSVRIGSEVKDLPAYEYLSTESAGFAKYADARANRRDPFFIHPAGGADICNVPVPVRRAGAVK